MGFRKRIKNAVRLRLNALRLRYVRAFRSYDAADLRIALRKVGIKPGDCIIAHCSFEPHHGFRGSIDQFIDALLAAVGESGTVAMVSMPYRSSTREYLARNPRFDVRRTPSAMGLISEQFRRRPGVLRSQSPTHPVLAWGRLAAELTTGHENCQYPCGPASPFESLLNHRGKALFVNATPFSMTFFHFLEHRVAALAGVQLYEPVVSSVSMVDCDGKMRTVQISVFSDPAPRQHAPGIFWRWVRDAGLISSAKLGATRLSVVELEQAAALVQSKADTKEFFYQRNS